MFFKGATTMKSVIILIILLVLCLRCRRGYGDWEHFRR